MLADKSASGGAVKNGNTSKQEITKELHKSIIRKFEKRKVYSPFIDKYWGADLADIQLIRKFNNENSFFIMSF